MEKPSKLGRRAFLVGLFTLMGAALLGLAFSFVPGRERRFIVAVLRKKLDYLTIPTADLEAFAEAMLAAPADPPWANRLRSWRLVVPIYEHTDFFKSSSSAQRLERLEEQIVTQFLLSSDFFTRGADPTQPVHFVAFYDPYVALCANPFARFD